MSLSLSFIVIFISIKEVTAKPDAKEEKYAILTKPVTPPPKEGADSKNRNCSNDIIVYILCDYFESSRLTRNIKENKERRNFHQKIEREEVLEEIRWS